MNAPESWLVRGVLLTFAPMLLAAVCLTPAAAQTAGDTVRALQTGTISSEPAPKKKKKNDAWRGSWYVTFGLTYDDNVFALSPGQKHEIGTDAGRYADMNAAYDIANTVRVRSEFRSPGKASRRLDVGAEARLELYTMSRRQTVVRLRLSAEQNLSKRDAVSARVSFTPSEFRRNYLIGTFGDGEAEYGAGVRRTIDGRLGYERTLLDGKGVPQIVVGLRLLGAQRSVRGFPWRDRREVGLELDTDLRLGALGLDLRAERSRTFHDGAAEPVWIDDTVTSMELNRDFAATTLGTETTLRLSRSARAGVTFQYRVREFQAALADDPVYGDRQDRRYTYGVELLLRLAPSIDLRLGGDYRRQLAFRPGRGDTGDEAQYSRRSAFLQLEYGL
jgi:hypothetical protein